MLSAAVACLPAPVSLLLLEVLFMQISGVSLTPTWTHRLCLLRVLLCVSLCYKLSPFQAHWGRRDCTCFLRPACLFTVHMESGSSPLSCGVFLPLPLLQASCSWLLGMCIHSCLLQLACEGFPLLPSSVLRAPCPLCYMSFLLFIAYYSVFFSFFPQWGLVCPGDYADLAQGCLLEYHLPLSSPCGPCLPKLSRRWRLVVAWKPSWFLRLT
jgi:hypothetical protein